MTKVSYELSFIFRNIEGDTCLRMACRLGLEEIARKLMDRQPLLSVKDEVDSLLLLGCSVYEKESHLNALMRLWMEAQELRSANGDDRVDDGATATCHKRMRTCESDDERLMGVHPFLTSCKKFQNVRVSFLVMNYSSSFIKAAHEN